MIPWRIRIELMGHGHGQLKIWIIDRQNVICMRSSKMCLKFQIRHVAVGWSTSDWTSFRGIRWPNQWHQWIVRYIFICNRMKLQNLCVYIIYHFVRVFFSRKPPPSQRPPLITRFIHWFNVEYGDILLHWQFPCNNMKNDYRVKQWLNTPILVERAMLFCNESLRRSLLYLRLYRREEAV